MKCEAMHALLLFESRHGRRTTDEDVTRRWLSISKETLAGKPAGSTVADLWWVHCNRERRGVSVNLSTQMQAALNQTSETIKDSASSANGALEHG